MIDIHTHILPALDDGAPDTESALAMAEMANRDGTSVLVATPHAFGPMGPILPDALSVAADAFRALLESRGIALTVRTAIEFPLLEDLPDRIRAGTAPTLDDSRRHVLMELPRGGNLYEPLIDVLFRLRLRDVRPVVAHPELCETFRENPSRVADLVERGAIIQVNASSFRHTGGGFVERLLLDGLVHVVASDAHNTTTRPPLLSAARERCAALLGPESANRLFDENPARILAGETPLPVSPGPGVGPIPRKPA